MGQANERMPKEGEALPGRKDPMKVSATHYVLGNPISPEDGGKLESIVVGTGCFWGTEKGFWRLPNVYSTSVGYTGGSTENPTYSEVCSGQTGHNEVVRIIWHSDKISLCDILRQFWESHDPTQGMGQGNDRGTQYRSGIYPSTNFQKAIAEQSLKAYQRELDKHLDRPKDRRRITTEILEPGSFTFYFAEDYHQQYLAKPGSNPYCSAQPLQISLPPVSEWGSLDGVSDAPAEGLVNKLPEKYWQKHAPTPHCVLRQSNAQISLSSL